MENTIIRLQRDPLGCSGSGWRWGPVSFLISAACVTRALNRVDMTERAANTTNQRHSVRAYANYVRAALPLHRTTLLPLDLAVVLKVYENSRFRSNFCLLKKENRTGGKRQSSLIKSTVWLWLVPLDLFFWDHQPVSDNDQRPAARSISARLCDV